MDGKLAGENTTVAGATPISWRFDLKSPAGSELDVYFDWFRIYDGEELLDDSYFSQDTIETGEATAEEVDPLSTSVMINPEMTEKAFSGKTVFLLTNNSMYYGGKKEIITNEAEKLKNKNGTLMIPKSLFEKINGGAKVEYDKNAGTVSMGEKVAKGITPLEENGIVYLPLRAAVENLMNKKVSWDQRDMAIIADEEVETRTKVHFTTKHYMFDDCDYIYRYLLFDNPSGEQMVADLQKNFPNKTHPRVYWTSDDVRYMQSKIESDPLWQKEYRETLNYADNILCDDLSYITEFTKRKASGQFKKRITALATVHLVSGDIRYAQKGVEMLKGFAAWEDLQGSQLLMGDWAEAMGIGFDAFYNYMKSTPTGEEDIKYIKSRMVDLIYPKHIDSYSKGRKFGYSWITLQDNFNGYIGGGIMCMLLAICDEEDIMKETAYLLGNVMQSLYVSASLFWPDGGYYEGVTYGDMEFENLMNGLDALFNCCNTDYGLGRMPGFTKAGNYFTYLYTPQGEKINFHDDGGGKYYNRFVPEYMGFRYGELLEAQLGHESKYLADLEFVINYGLKGIYYYDKAITDKGIEIDVSQQPLDYYSYTIDTGTFRNSHADPKPTYVGFHAGWTNIAHDMLDLGEFAFVADGVAWARDLGNDDYSLPAYFSKDGYKIYRKKSEGENCLVINPQVNPEKYYGQEIGVRATTVALELNKPKGAFAAFDLTPAYSRDVENYIRGYYFGDNRNTLIVQDEVKLLGESEMYWFMHTPAQIEIVSNTQAVLTKNGKSVTVDVYCNKPGFELKQMEAAPLPTSPYIDGQNQNEGYTKLALHYPKVEGDVVIAVKLSPETDDYVKSPLEYIPISQWTVPDGEAIQAPFFTKIYADGKLIPRFAPGKQSYTVELPYGTEKAPVITATSNVGNITITQAETPNSTAVLKVVHNEEETVCKVSFKVSNDKPISVKRKLSKAVPTAGIAKETIAPVSITALGVSGGMEKYKNITDGDLATTYAFSHTNDWLEFDLGQVTNISGVAMAFKDGNTNRAAFKILYSEDGVNYNMVYEGTSSGTISGIETLQIPGRARYIRFVAMGNTKAGQTTTLAEFKVCR